MLLGCIADDFTGASDLANTLAKAGMSTVQFVGAPRGPAPAECEAGVVALETRSIAAADAVTQSLAALEWLKTQGCQQFLFKYCSTFDSTPEGNIGPVAEALLDALEAPVAVACPVFPATGRTAFMGHLFVGDRLLSESGMEKHPLNPMTDSDLRRWLRLQTKSEIGFVPHDIVRDGSNAVATRLDEEGKAGRRLAVVDAIEDRDLLTIGEAIAGHKLVTGGSGIALGLPENFRKAGLLAEAGSAYSPTKGPGVVLSGSCSTASQAQLSSYRKHHPGLAIDPAELMAGRQTAVDIAAFVYAHLAHLFDLGAQRGGEGADEIRSPGARGQDRASVWRTRGEARRGWRHPHRRRRRRDLGRGGDGARDQQPRDRPRDRSRRARARRSRRQANPARAEERQFRRD